MEILPIIDSDEAKILAFLIEKHSKELEEIETKSEDEQKDLAILKEILPIFSFIAIEK